MNNFFNVNFFLNTHHFFSISCLNTKWQYIFFRKFSERYFIVKKNKNFFAPYNVWNNWYPMTHWSNCFYTSWNFNLMQSFMKHWGFMKYFKVSNRKAGKFKLYIFWINISKTFYDLTPLLLMFHEILKYFKWKFQCFNETLHRLQPYDRLVCNTLYPPVNKLFLSVTKFSLYISPYISFSKLVPMTYVLPFLKVLLRRLRMPHEFVCKKHLIFNFLLIHAQ